MLSTTHPDTIATARTTVASRTRALLEGYQGKELAEMLHVLALELFLQGGKTELLALAAEEGVNRAKVMLRTLSPS